MKVVIIGTGNVASVFGTLFARAGFTITQVFGRNITNATALAGELGAAPCNSWGDIDREADIYLAAISDNALYELDKHLVLTKQLVLHTAGAVSIDLLKKISMNYGVIYPLQSLRKEMPVLTEIPLLVEGNNEDSSLAVWEIAMKLSHSVSKVNSESRLKLHVAAVFINNFTNHLYTVTADYCKKENIPFSLLMPLLAETARRLELVSPEKVMTGPAVRKDNITISLHLDVLKEHPLLQKLYRQMTESIREFNGKV